MEQQEVFFENEFVVYHIDHVEKQLEVMWKPSPQSTLYDELFKSIITKQKEGVIKYQPDTFLINSANLTFTISPELQIWFDQQIFPAVAQAGVRKIAIVISKDLFTMVSIEQTMEEGDDTLGRTRYFDDESKARDWLNY